MSTPHWHPLQGKSPRRWGLSVHWFMTVSLRITSMPRTFEPSMCIHRMARETPTLQQRSDVGEKKLCSSGTIQNWLTTSQKNFIPKPYRALPIAHSFPVFILALRKGWKIQVDHGDKNDGHSDFRKGDNVATNASDFGLTVLLLLLISLSPKGPGRHVSRG